MLLSLPPPKNPLPSLRREDLPSLKTVMMLLGYKAANTHSPLCLLVLYAGASMCQAAVPPTNAIQRTRKLSSPPHTVYLLTISLQSQPANSPSLCSPISPPLYHSVGWEWRILPSHFCSQSLSGIYTPISNEFFTFAHLHDN